MKKKVTGKPSLKDFRKLETDYAELAEKTTEAVDKAKSLETKLAHAINFPTVHTGNRTGSDETKALTMFGCGDNVKKLIEVNTEAPEFSFVPKELKGMVRQLKSDFVTARVISQMFYDDPWDRVGANPRMDAYGKCKNLLESNFGKNVLAPKLKAFGTAIVGSGAEWLDLGIAATHIPELELDREIMGLMQPVAMPTSPYQLNTSGSSIARRGTELVQATEGDFLTGELNFSAKKYQEYYIFSEEINEDSAVQIVALGRQNLTRAHLNAFEMSLVNGVEFGTVHLDSDTEAGSADLAEKQFNGLRKLAVDNSANGSTVDFGNAQITDAKLREMRQSMGKFGINPADLVWIPGSTAYLQMLGTENVVTIDKMGPNATILKGQLGAYDGIGISQTGYMRNTLNAAGVYDGITTDRTGILLIHRMRLYWATRRAIRMVVRPSLSSQDRIEMASYSRVDFKAHDQADNETELTVAYGHNIPA